MQDPIGDEFKSLERDFSSYVESNNEIIIRLDGRGFSDLTKTIEKPYSSKLTSIMDEVTKKLMSECNAKVGYTQSDEISLYIQKTNNQVYFNGSVNKINSVLASKCSFEFNHLAREQLPAMYGAMFDCRVFQCQTEQVKKYFLWRFLDARRNSVTQLSQSLFDRNKLDKVKTKDRIKMCKDIGKPWESFPERFRFGKFYFTEYIEHSFKDNPEALALLPEKHEARRNPDGIFKRKVYREFCDFNSLESCFVESTISLPHRE